ncbi:gibberellin-regulated protein 12-like [Papaver somniferum]|uniref:gibberellin-regulated protein 12-like n=1 Tax=Papaver somniferum TaxID=3469 RepID=UPI000E6F824A|nr:gibberellin-regulated protein 12-like [Papaver somniferum]
MARFSSPLISYVFVFTAFFFFVQLSFGENGGEGSLRPQECASACQQRCSATSHKKPCLLYCNKCCNKCLCVPSGTYGHKEECPCYNNLKTQEGKPKCP